MNLNTVTYEELAEVPEAIQRSLLLQLWFTSILEDGTRVSPNPSVEWELLDELFQGNTPPPPVYRHE